MKALAIYWLIGCLFVGLSAGAHETRCPSDPAVSPTTYIVAIATWPAGIVWGAVNSTQPPCRVLP